MIYAAFTREVGRDNVFMDIDSIPPGANFRKILKEWVDQCDILLVLIGAEWLGASDARTGLRRLDNPSDFVRIEIAEALARDIPVVPVLIDGAPLPHAAQLPAELKELCDRQAEFIEYRTFDADVERLIKKLRAAWKPGGAPEIPDTKAPASPSTATEIAAEKAVIASKPAAQPQFGTLGVTFSVGSWRIKKISNELIHLWNVPGDKVIELIANSNGWWHLRDRSGTSIVWPTGGREDASFYAEPSTAIRASEALVNISGATYKHAGSSYSTLITVAGGRIIVTLHDKGELALDPAGARIDFKTYDGKKLVY
jgi:hypothetical protein